MAIGKVRNKAKIEENCGIQWQMTEIKAGSLGSDSLAKLFQFSAIVAMKVES